MNELAGSRLRLSGQGYYVKAIVTRMNDSYQMVVVNYDPNMENKEIVPVLFNNIKNGNYQIKVEYFNNKKLEFDKQVVDNLLNLIIPMKINSAAYITIDRI